MLMGVLTGRSASFLAITHPFLLPSARSTVAPHDFQVTGSEGVSTHIETGASARKRLATITRFGKSGLTRHIDRMLELGSQRRGQRARYIYQCQAVERLLDKGGCVVEHPPKRSCGRIGDRKTLKCSNPTMPAFGTSNCRQPIRAPYGLGHVLLHHGLRGAY